MAARKVAVEKNEVDPTGKPGSAVADDHQSHYDENGPDGQTGMQPNHCTDLCCLIIFIAFMFGMAYVAEYSFRNGDPRRLTHGFDWNGRLCGVDQDVVGQPLLYWCGEGPVVAGIPAELNLKAPICVDKCPDSFSTTLPCLEPSVSTAQTTGVAPYTQLTRTIIQKVSPQPSYPTTELAGVFCVPSVSQAKNLTEQLLNPNGPLGNGPAKAVSAVGGAKRAWLVLVVGAIVAIIGGYAYLFALRHCAMILVQVVLGIVTAIFLLSGASLLAGEVFKLAGATDMLDTWEQKNPLYHEYDEDTARWISLISGIVMTSIGLSLLCVICCARNAIYTAIGCIEAACECMFSMPSLLVQPIIDAAWKVFVGAVLIYGFMWLVSTGEMTTKSITVHGKEVGGLRRSFKFTDEGVGMIIYYLFGFFWIMELTNAVTQFVISYAVVLWYYTPVPKGFGPRAPLVRGFLVCITFHLGTVAVGSFLIALCRLLRLIVSYIAKQAEAQGNCVVASIAKCCACCITCVQKFIEQLNKNAYIDVCINSNDFCTAAGNSFKFMSSQPLEIAILNGACFIFTFAGILGIAGGVGALTFEVITSFERWTSDTSPQHVSSPEFVAGVAFVLAGLIAYAFMMVFDQTADTLLYTFCWNKTHGHNSVQKYATATLRNLTNYQPLSKGRPQSSAHNSGGGWFSSFFGGGSSSATSEEQRPLKGSPR